MILRDLYCPGCDHEKTDVFIEGESYPDCPRCGTRMKNHITKINTDAWAGPQYHPALDRTFDSKSEYKAYLREKKLVEVGDKVGGARNADYLGLGKRFGYAGQRNRSSRDYAETRKHRAPVPKPQGG